MAPVNDWYAHLAQRNRSPETLRTYRSVMDHYLKVVGDPLTADVGDAEAWWETIETLAPKSRQRALSCVRSFYAWAVRFDLIVRDPTRRLDAPTQGQRLPAPIGRADLLTIMRAADPDMRRAIVLGAYAGMRVAEAAALDWSDVDTESMRIRVRGKGDKERPVGLSPVLLDELLPNVGGNVVAAGAAPYSAGALQRRVNRLISSQGVNATFHKLRARYVTVALGNGAPLLSVSRAVGHASPTTTAIYALTADSDLDLIAEAVTR